MRKLLVHCLFYFLSAAMLAACGVDRAYAEKAKKENVSTVLDQLEKRLTDQEANADVPDDQSASKSVSQKDKETDTTTQKMKFKEKQISASNKESNRLTDLSTAVSTLEEEIEKLANDVQGTKQKVMEQAKLDNFIEINAELADSRRSAIRSLMVKIDGYPVYSLEEASGLWLPSKSLPLYAGPMQPGSHSFEVEVSLIVKAEDSSPINGHSYKTVTKNFPLSIPDGVYKKRWTLELSAPQTTGTEAEAKLSQAP